jgi:hypothetical protein
MKKTFLFLALIPFFSLIVSCGNPGDNDNKGAQSSQDYPSNRDRDVDSTNTTPSAQMNQDTNMISNGSNPNGEPPNQAPNNGTGNPSQSIQGQSGTNQTGQPVRDTLD